jgi:hypothetical protein
LEYKFEGILLAIERIKAIEKINEKMGDIEN